MKFFKVLNELFTVFCYLTLGSFFLIIAFHWWPLEDAIETLYRVYHSYSFSVVITLAGSGFILLGLIILRLTVKTNPQNEALIYRTDAGLVVVSGKVIEDVARKVLRKSPFVRESKIRLNIRGQLVILNLRLGLWESDLLPSVVQEIQESIQARLQKILGRENKVEISCDINKIYHSDEVSSESEKNQSQKPHH